MRHSLGCIKIEDLIGRAKRASHIRVSSMYLGERSEPHTGVFNRDFAVGMSSVVYGKTIQKNCMLKCVGGIT